MVTAALTAALVMRKRELSDDGCKVLAEGLQNKRTLKNLILSGALSFLWSYTKSLAQDDTFCLRGK
eukprot:1225724-Pleurochrysis_carterae.AAC.1